MDSESQAAYLQTVVGQAFEAEFGRTAEVIARAPGRVNMIGEHTDYNDGFVLPIAIDRAVYVAAAARNDDAVNLVAHDFDDRASFDLSDIRFDEEHRWSNYPRGVAWALRQRGLALRGMDAVIGGDVPIGAGLSSSAAIEVATATALRALSGFNLPEVEMALAAQEAENRFVGMSCGIMDQFISVLGQRGRALLIDCRSLDYQSVPLPPGCDVIVANTMKRRELVDSEYNRRRAECEEGVHRLREFVPGIRALRDVSLEDLQRHAGRLPENVLRRCRHVVSENARALAAATALREGDAQGFGQLMVASHESLRKDYEVSCDELDEAVRVALEEPGVYGARMTGAGFGGCTVNLVARESSRQVEEALARGYERWAGVRPEIYVCRAEDGAEAKRLR